LWWDWVARATQSANCKEIVHYRSVEFYEDIYRSTDLTKKCENARKHPWKYFFTSSADSRTVVRGRARPCVAVRGRAHWGLPTAPEKPKKDLDPPKSEV
jgi:hypothetical protein